MINGKSVTYALTGTDTTATAAAALQALLATVSGTAAVPPEFTEQTWTVSGAVITVTDNTPGTPFTLTASATGGGATITRASKVANSSPSDVNNANNWLRNGSPSLPQNGDDVVLANSSVPLLWNLTALAAVTFNSFTRYQSFTGAVGLPENNPNGYVEYRPTYFQFLGPVGALPLVLGVGPGSGPTRERYNVLGQQTNLIVLASGSPADAYAVRFLGTHASNTAKVLNTSVGIGMLPGETSTLASASLDGGGTLDLGVGVTFSGTLTMNGGSSNLACAPATLLVQNGGQATLSADALTYAALTAQGGSVLNFLAGGTITVLNLLKSSTLNKSNDLRTLTITNATVDGDTCQIFDPNGVITFTNAVTMNGQVTVGPIQTSSGRTWKIT